MIPEKIYWSLRMLICPFDRIAIHVPKKGKLLDVGCGYGIFCSMLAESGTRAITGVDIDARRIMKAASKAASKPNLRFLPGGIEAVDDKERFDVITCLDLFHHVGRSMHQPMMSKMKTLLKTQGVLIIKDMDTKPFRKYLWNYIHDVLMTRSLRMHYVSIQEMSRLLAKNGFSIELREDLSNPMYAHYLIVARPVGIRGPA